MSDKKASIRGGLAALLELLSGESHETVAVRVRAAKSSRDSPRNGQPPQRATSASKVSGTAGGETAVLDIVPSHRSRAFSVLPKAVIREIKLLAILHEYPAGLHGLAIADEAKDQGIPRSTVYAALGNLVGKALVEERALKTPHKGPQRRIYSLSSSGAAVLREMEFLVRKVSAETDSPLTAVLQSHEVRHERSSSRPSLSRSKKSLGILVPG